MPDFQYIARDLAGSQVTDVISASSQQEALSMLAARSLFPVRVDATDSAAVAQRRIGGRVRPRHTAVFYTQLADLLRSGVPLLRSLELLERQSVHPSLKLVIQDVREQVADGMRLADAMKRHPRVFGELGVSMVHAGEEGSFLEDVLKRIANFTEHQEDLKARVLGAMVYPVFLMVMGAIIVALMLTFFVPKFAPIFERMQERGSLPWPTIALMGLSNSLQIYGPMILLGLAAAVFLAVTWVKTDDGRLAFDRFKLASLKVGNVSFGVGPIVRSLAIARFCRILGTLLKNGVPILQSLRIAKDATGNRVLSTAIAQAAERVSAGKSLGGPLKQSGQFPEEIVEMIAVGEEANNLEQVLIDIADNMERHTDRKLELFVRLLEPIMLMLMAGVILFVVVALLLPILQSSGVF
ncbi:MAG: type II secretion system F family protein [Planctomycetes bacterium]|nr:type II secretion system F family protein [Planctomycetota bacterium]